MKKRPPTKVASNGILRSMELDPVAAAPIAATFMFAPAIVFVTTPFPVIVVDNDIGRWGILVTLM
jgi:hypothetical protein